MRLAVVLPAVLAVRPAVWERSLGRVPERLRVVLLVRGRVLGGRRWLGLPVEVGRLRELLLLRVVVVHRVRSL